MKDVAKVALWLFLAGLLAGILYLGGEFFGNPVSHVRVRQAAERHLEEVYPDTDFTIEKVGYNFKNGNYYARIMSPTGVDQQFFLSFYGNGQLILDNYQEWVLSGRNTMNRISREYYQLAKAVFTLEALSYDGHTASGRLKELFDVRQGAPEERFGLVPAELEVNGDYDVRALGAQYGELTLHVYDEDVSFQRAGEILLEVKRVFAEQALPFYAIDFTLEKPRQPDGSLEDGPEIRLYHVLCSEIETDGLAERIEAAHNESVAYLEALYGES